MALPPDSLSLHVTFGTSKKIILCQLSKLTSTIEQVFHLEGKDFFFQIWNSDFDDWVDLGGIEELVGRAKLRLQVLLR